MNRRAMLPAIRLVALPLVLALAACSAAPAQPPLDQAPLAGADVGGDFALTGADGQVYIPLQATSADISQNFVARYESYDATPITPGNAYADMTVNILYR